MARCMARQMYSVVHGCHVPSSLFPALVEKDPVPRTDPHVSSAFDRCGHAASMLRPAPMFPGPQLHLESVVKHHRCL